MYYSVNGIHFIHLWKSLWEDDCRECSNYCPCTGASMVNESKNYTEENTHMKHVGKGVWAQSTFNNFYIWRKIVLHTKNIYMYTWSVQIQHEVTKTITTAVFILQEMSPHISTSTTFNGNRMLTFIPLLIIYLGAVSAKKIFLT